MSFEGYYQILCENGHYDEMDVYAMEANGEWNCYNCGTDKFTTNIVDTTNGVIEGTDRCPGYVEMKLVHKKKCEHCDSILERLYERPTE